ncbi:MAG: DUF3224 domain-containing protein [Chitinophagales bacterium]
MTRHAKGEFEVSIVPQTDREVKGLNRMTIDKQFKGDLDAITQGQMLSARTDIPESAGYVAMERVTGKLHGREGSFVLQHTATINRGESSLLITVVPDSGTGELSGLTGTLSIDIVDKKHYYEFIYDLPEMNS